MTAGGWAVVGVAVVAAVAVVWLVSVVIGLLRAGRSLLRSMGAASSHLRFPEDAAEWPGSAAVNLTREKARRQTRPPDRARRTVI